MLLSSIPGRSCSYVSASNGRGKCRFWSGGCVAVSADAETFGAGLRLSGDAIKRGWNLKRIAQVINAQIAGPFEGEGGLGSGKRIAAISWKRRFQRMLPKPGAAGGLRVNKAPPGETGPWD